MAVWLLPATLVALVPVSAAWQLARSLGRAPPPCSDIDLARFSRSLAEGPLAGAGRLAAPQCVPAASQGLWVLPEETRRAADSRGIVAFRHQSQTRSEPTASGDISDGARAKAHLVHLYVAQSNADWCPAPCQGPTWELAAPKPEAGSPYVLLEAAIWRQERRVALYRFDAAWEGRARQAYHEVCDGAGWECPQYAAFRESYRLLSVGPWPASADSDPKELSAFLLDAFRQVFAKVQQAATGEHLVLTYSGHGAVADGSLFEGALARGDAETLLQEVTGAKSQNSHNKLLLPQLEYDGLRPMGRLSVLNFGGNCAEGRWNMVASLSPYANWIIASDLKVGGVEMTEEENTMENMKERELLGDMAVFKRAAESRESLDHMVQAVVSARKQLWDTVWKPGILRQKLPQSIAAFRTDLFPVFQAAIRHRYLALSGPGREQMQAAAEGSACDVLTTVRAMDGDASPPPAALWSRSRLLQAFSSRLGDRQSSLAAQFSEFRALYESTRHLVPWESKASGLGFNFLGWKEPPCDLVGVFGGEAPAPPGGWKVPR